MPLILNGGLRTLDFSVRRHICAGFYINNRHMKSAYFPVRFYHSFNTDFYFVIMFNLGGMYCEIVTKYHN